MHRIAIVVSETNDFITDRLLDGALNEFPDAVVVEVAGAFELIAATRKAFDAGFEGVVALGVIIRGETPHFEYIANAVTHGLSLIAAEGRAVSFGVLTVDTVAQASDRAGGSLGNKGVEAARALASLLAAFRNLQAHAS